MDSLLTTEKTKEKPFPYIVSYDLEPLLVASWVCILSSWRGMVGLCGRG